MSTSDQHSSRALTKVIFSGAALCVLLITAAVAWDGSSHLPTGKRPILIVLAIYLAAFAVSMLSLRYVVKQREHRSTLKAILAFGIAFRLIMLFSTPFLEIDIYRYLWDGITLSHGVSPYRWSPEEALSTPDGSVDHERITEIANASESVHAIVKTVHFPEYTTIYPPVSQAVFAGTMWFVPDRASAKIHLWAMKLILIGFDVGTMFLVLAGLRAAGRNAHWVLAYAWNPLIMKEIANSGHLDSIAVFFTSLSMLLAVRELNRSTEFRKRIAAWLAFTISLGIGAKLFPVVLVPLFFIWIWQRTKPAALVFAGSTALFVCLIMLPMLMGKNTDTSRQKDGLSGFLSKWRMNALAFDFVYENTIIHDESSEPWYSIVPVSFRERMIGIANRVPLRTSAPTTVARLVTLSTFAMIYLAVLGNRIRQGGDAALLPVDAFVVLAGFLFLQPTVNPWYWTWVLPFACFIRKFGWHMAGGCLLFYYARFWFKLSSIAIPLGGVEYTGVDCFDHLVVWVEYALLVALVVGLPRLDSTGDVASDH